MANAWHGIDEFVAVASLGSFSAAATRLGCSVTHCSRAVAGLEARVQAQLLHRTTRRVALTDTGRTFLAHCERMILERDEAIALVSDRGEPQGELRVTCSTAMGERFVAPILARYLARHPGLSVTLELTNRVVDLVAEGFDLAIRTGQLADSRLIGTRIASRSLYTCAAPAYLARMGRPAGVADLPGHDCLIGTASTWHFRVNGEEAIYRPRGRWRVNSGAAVVDAALSGMGLCQLPEFYVLPHLASGALELVLADIRPDDQPIWAIYPQRRHLSPKIARLVGALRSALPVALGAG
jgi:DNA-binding transcriptional LysR family regulator